MKEVVVNDPALPTVQGGDVDGSDQQRQAVTM